MRAEVRVARTAVENAARPGLRRAARRADSIAPLLVIWFDMHAHLPCRAVCHLAPAVNASLSR